MAKYRVSFWEFEEGSDYEADSPQSAAHQFARDRVMDGNTEDITVWSAHTFRAVSTIKEVELTVTPLV